MNFVARTLAPAALVAVGIMNTAPVHADDNGFLGSEMPMSSPRSSPIFRAKPM